MITRRNIRTWSAEVLFAAVLLVKPISVQASAVGLSQGKLSAQPSGGVSYEMPIVVSPGTAGIQPKLSFQYSSGGRNGALGMGWSVSGVSAITRAPQTLAQDGAIHGVDMTLQDRYSMDGQRLIAIVGTDGYAGTEYRTEINSFTKVIANGASGNGPATFTAWTKSGLIYTFGGGSATFVPAGRTDGTILTWLLSRIQDQAGNYMTFSYTSEGNLASVNYAMNDAAGLGGYASVVFTYNMSGQSRPDPALGYVAGSSISMTQRLDRVTSYVGSTIVRQYDLAYGISPTTGKLRLISITEGTGSQTYPPTVFTWDNNTNTINQQPSLLNDPQKDNTSWTQGDFIGDGTCQMARMRDGVIKVYRVSDFSNPVIAFTSTQTFDSTQDVWLQGDFNGDGKLDLIRVHAQGNTPGNPVTFTTFTNTGNLSSGFIQSNATIQDPQSVSPPFYASRTYLAMDVNGDGKMDIVCINGVDPRNGSARPTNITVYLNNPNGNQPGTFVAQRWGYTSVDDAAHSAPGSDQCTQTDRWFVGDFNGDGLPDLAKVWENNGKNTVRIYLNQNGSYVAANWIYKSGTFFEADGKTPAYVWVTGDFNGDGLIDFVRIPKAANQDGAKTADVFLSTGTAFAAPQPWLSLVVGEQAKIQTGDYNADGRTDLIILKDHVNGSNTSTTATGEIMPPNDPGPIPGVDLSAVSGLTAYLDDPVTLALEAANNAQSSPTPSPLPALSPTPDPGSLIPPLCQGCIPLTVYPNGSEADLVWGTASGGAASTAAATGAPYTYSCQRAVYLSNGGANVPNSAGFYLQSFGDDPQMNVQSYSTPIFQRWFTADFNGDGKEDLLRKFLTTDSSGQRYANFNVYLSSYGYQDLMRAVTDGMGSTTSIDYEPLTGVTGVNVFTKSSDAVSPAIDLIEPMPVVASITYDNGLNSPGSPGSTYTVSYRYTGLKADPLRGMLGFETVEAVDNRALDGQPGLALHTKSWLKQGFPYTGMASRAVTYLDSPTATFSGTSKLLSDAQTTYAAGPTENNNTHIYFPYAQYGHVFSWDLNSTATNDTETIVQSIDAYGNTGTSVVRTKDLPSSNYFIKTTSSNYNVSTSNWRIGQVTSSSVTSQAPGQPDIIRTSGFGYNSSNGEVGSETIEPGSGSSLQTSYTFDAFGNIRVATASSNDTDAITGQAVPPRTTFTNYDNQGRFVTSITNALNQGENKTYDTRFGAVTSVKGPNNLIDTAQYDDFGRKILSTRADGTNTKTSYEWVAGNSDSHINPPANAVYLVRVVPDDGAQGIAYFDRLGRELRKETIAGNGKTEFVDSTYDYRGRKSTVIKPYFKGDSPTTAISYYDALDRVVTLQLPSVDETGASITTYTTTVYNGLNSTATNPKGQSTTMTKDAAGHVRQVVDALNGSINYTYDAVGNLIQTVDAAGNTTTISYDVRGRKTSVNDPDLGLWNYTYYSTGELKTQTDARNQVVKFSYDQLGRITNRLEPTNDTTVWTYDTASGKGIGKLASVQFTPHQGSTLAPYANGLSYDQLGRLDNQSATIHNNVYTSSTVYDQFSRPWELLYPNGLELKNFYDTNGYLTEIDDKNSGAAYWKANNYDADGHITEEQYGNGVITDRVYIPQNGLLKTVKSGLGGGTGVQNLEYHFDVLGNLKSRKDNNQTVQGSTLQEAFNYDALNRLINWTVTGQPQQNVIYDQVGSSTASLGNIKHKDGVGDYTYPAAGSAHPHAVLTAGNSGTAAYDNNGNMTSGFGRSITWTWFNQPQLITGSGGSSYFEYDDNHHRVWQHASGSSGVVDTVYVGGFYEAVDDGNTIKRKCYINAPTGRVAVYTETYDKHTYGTSYDTKYLHKDHLGSVDVVTDASGALLERDSFDAWGFRRTTDWQAQRPIGSTSIVSRGFTGHEELDSLGLVNMNGRIYDPGIGRFLSADPTLQFPHVTQDFNRYSYVLNNPLSFSDPSGFGLFDALFAATVDLFKFVTGNISSTQFWHALVTTAAATAVYFALLPIPYVGPIVAAFGSGFTAGFVSSMFSGASLGQAFQAGAIGGGIAVATAGILGGLGVNGDPSGPTDYFVQLGETAAVGAASGAAQAAIYNQDPLKGAYESAEYAAGEYVWDEELTRYFYTAGRDAQERLPQNGPQDLGSYREQGLLGILQYNAGNDAQGHAESRGYPFFALQSHGFLSDILHAFMQIALLGHGDSAARVFRMYALQLNNGMMGDVTFRADSEGTLTLMNAVRMGGLEGSHAELYAPAINYFVAKSIGANHGVNVYYEQHSFDISNTYSFNPNPLKFLSGFLDIPMLFRTHTTTYPEFSLTGP